MGWVKAFLRLPSVLLFSLLSFGRGVVKFPLLSLTEEMLKWKVGFHVKKMGDAAVGSGGTVHVESFDSNLYAINPDGSLNWYYAI